MIETLICITISIIALVIAIPSIVDYKRRVKIKYQSHPPICYNVYMSNFGGSCIIVSILTGVYASVYGAFWLFGS